MILRAFFVLLCFSAGVVQAQQYRWTDDKGNVRYTGTPPPAGAKNVQKLDTAAATDAPAEQVPFEVARLQKDFPVTLYTAPSCKEGCDMARGALNKRGVPFKEVQVWNPETADQLKQVSAAAEVPTLVVGRYVQRGFEQGGYDELLDSAGYPKAGQVPPRSQKAPAPPEGYVAADESKKPAQSPNPVAPQKAGPYDTSGLTGPAPKTGQYGVPAEAK
ncbi:MAG TPA: glutaredoxin family protein [Burkholderiales bacterium]|nr:glutaredoxin family protein [Burkholderiales bacterium]